MKVILFEPQIPQNAGNIIRTCSVTGTDLMFVKPLGFATTDRWLKRAALDHMTNVPFTFCEDFKKYLEDSNNSFYFLSSKGKRRYDEVAYDEDSELIFGSETAGLPDWIHQTYPDRMLRIPMKPEARCLNLATSVGIVLFEALRQKGFKGAL